MNKISPPVKLMYYMLLNKGNICGDPDVIIARMGLPITINESYAEECIKDICDRIADAANQSGSVKLIKLTTYDFCHFYRDKSMVTNATRAVKSQPIRVTYKMNGVFRRVK